MDTLSKDYIGNPSHVGVETELSQDISRRVMEHRNRFRRLIFNRYCEFLPLLINYTNTDETGIDFVKLETALRMGYEVVVGRSRTGVIMILGYIQNHKREHESYHDFMLTHERRLNEKDITFTVPEYLIPDYALEIQHYDNCKSGDFVVLKNKPVNWNNDYEIIEHYCDELAEIILSRFSLIMQAKMSKIFKSEINDETINQFITQLFNGSPYIKVSGLFDPEDDIIDLGSDYVTNALVEMKREYQNKISELSNFLGVNSLAVDKESGVSDAEAKSNRAFTTSNSNIYIRGREPIQMLNRRFDLNITPFYDDEATSKINIQNFLYDGEGANNHE